MSGRIIALFLLIGLSLAATLPLIAATSTTGSKATRALLEAYAGEDPGVVAKTARPLAEKGNAEAQFVLGLFHLIGAGVSIDHVAAATWINRAAAQGHTEAQLCLAWQHETGLGVTRIDPAMAPHWRGRAQGTEPAEVYARWFARSEGVAQPNFSRAFLWMIDAADAGNPVAIANLAQVHLFNFWTQADPTQHLQWLQRAVDAGDLASVEQLSLYYTFGVLLPMDTAKGLELLQRAATGGRPGAQLLLGRQYETGESVPRDLKLAVSWMEKAAKQDHLPALHHLIDLRRNGRPELPPDYPEAVRLAEKGHKLADATCTRHLADLHIRGEGVTRNAKKSAEFYRVAANQGETNAMTMLGWIHDKGETGPPDYAEARRWYEKSATLGNLRALRELGAMHEAGRGGAADLSAAFIWYEKAARAGEAYAQEKLGRMLAKGMGVPQDSEEAVNWFRLAASNAQPESLATRFHDWLHDDSVPLLEGLIQVAREHQDTWVHDNLVAAVVASPRRAELELRILALLEESDLLSVVGILPEACFAILEANTTDPTIGRHAAGLFHRLRAADRSQSAGLLGLCAFRGRHMPRDQAAALRWARVAAASTPWKGQLAVAWIEAFDSSDPSRRDISWDTLRKFAKAGDQEAGLLLLTRVIAGQGSDEDKLLAEFNFTECLAYARNLGHAALTERLEKFKFGQSEAEMVSKIAELLAARKPGATVPAQPVFRHAPYYPLALSKARISGRVLVEFTIGLDGRVIEPKILRSDHEAFSAQAVAAVLQSRFAPAWKNGKTVTMRVSQLLEFNVR